MMQDTSNEKWRGWLISSVAIFTSLIHLYAPGFGLWPSLRVVSVAAFTTLTLMMSPLQLTFLRFGRAFALFIDVVLITGAIAVGFYAGWDYNALQLHSGQLSTMDITMGLILTITVLEATRRTIGKPLVILALFAIAYAILGPHMPFVIAHKGADLSSLMDYIFILPCGIYGIPVGVTSTYIVIFVMFGALLDASGAANYITELSRTILGRYTGGPAKMAIGSSALMGSISGSAVANVVTTGSFTIPLMIRMGLPKKTAGAVEAAASTGGLFLPPIMGAAAFIVAETLGIGYLKVIVAAAIPALLYYFGLFWVAHFQSKKYDARGLDPRDCIPLKILLKQSWWIFVPILVLVVFLVGQYSALRAASGALVTLAGLAIVFKGPKDGFFSIVKALDRGAQATASIMMACACAGVIIAVIFVTGLGLRFASIVLNLSGGFTFLALLFTMVVTLVLGMGLPVTASYLTASTLAVPVLTKLQVTPLAAHMFILYYSALSAITPPVCLATYAAVGIAGSKIWETGIAGVRFGLIGFIIPFFFCYDTKLLVLGSNFGEVAYATLTATIGTFALSVAMVGFMFSRIQPISRLILTVGGIAFISYGFVSDGIGFVLITIVIAGQFISWMKERKSLLAAKPVEVE